MQKTAQIASDMIANINALMDDGNFKDAEKMIDDAMKSPNRPFRIEFAAQSAAMQ